MVKFFGKFKGRDKFGNEFYEMKDKSRWMINRKKNLAQPDQGWHPWLYKITEKPIEVNNIKRRQYGRKAQGRYHAWKPKEIDM